MHGSQFLIALVALVMSGVQGPAVAGQKVRLASKGQALQPVRVADDASTRTRAATETLATILSKISGAKFELSTGPAETGIVVGTGRDFPNLPWARQWAHPQPQQRRVEREYERKKRVPPNSRPAPRSGR